MKKKIVLVGILFLVLLQVVGCAGLNFFDDKTCESAPECSLICSKIESPQTQDLLIQVTNEELLFQNAYSAADAIVFIDKVAGYIAEVKTYADLTNKVDAELALLPERIRNKLFILSKYSPLLSSELPICDFDRGLLLKGLENQRTIALKYL